jgi:hypothetical protein
MAKTSAVSSSGGMMVKHCNCESSYSDKHYGKGLRPHNKTTKGHRCCICGKSS